MKIDPIQTERLTLVAATPATLRIPVKDTDTLSNVLGASVPDWPPQHFDQEAVDFLAGLMESNPENIPWCFRYMILRESAEVVGTIGFKGIPDETGMVEVGYSVVDSRHRRGFASEALEAMVNWAFEDPAVIRVTGQTYPELEASIRTMLSAGFKPIGDGWEERTIAFEIRRS